MARASFKISTEVREVLKRSKLTEKTLELPAQLDRALYLEVNKVLAGAGGKWNRSAGLHVFSLDPRELLGIAVETGEAVNLKTKLQAFYTPRPLAERMAELAEIGRGDLVLEPSAGGGALARAARDAGGSPCCVEIDSVALAALRADGFPTIPGDFLTMTAPTAGYDRIIMNPPFADGQAVDHVFHAFGFLAPHGILVSVVPEGFWGGPRRQAAALATLSAALDHEEKLAEGTFAESGTLVRTRLIKLRKP